MSAILVLVLFYIEANGTTSAKFLSYVSYQPYVIQRIRYVLETGNYFISLPKVLYTCSDANYTIGVIRFNHTLCL